MSLKDEQVFVSTCCFGSGLTIQEILDLSFKMNIPRIEFGGTNVFDQNLYSILNRYAGNWLAHSYFPTPKETFYLNFASDDKDVICRSFEQIERSLDFCLHFNIPHFSIHPGVLVDPQVSCESNSGFHFNGNLIPREKGIANFYRNFEKLINLFSRHKLKLLFEIQGSIEKNSLLIFNTPNEIERLFNTFGTNDVGLLCDFGHLNLASIANNYSREEFVKDFWDEIIEFHISDNNGEWDQHNPINEDSWLLKKFGALSKENKFIVLEYRSYPYQELKSILYNSIELLKKYF